MGTMLFVLIDEHFDLLVSMTVWIRELIVTIFMGFVIDEKTQSIVICDLIFQSVTMSTILIF